MGKGGFIIIIIIIILLFMTIERGGLNEIKNNPVQSTIDSGKTIYETGKEIVNEVKELNLTKDDT